MMLMIFFQQLLCRIGYGKFKEQAKYSWCKKAFTNITENTLLTKTNAYSYYSKDNAIKFVSGLLSYP